MFTTGILADIWNIVDFGIEPSLDLIQSWGAQSVSLTVTSSRISQLRIGELNGNHLFRSEGGYFFQPDKAKYSNTRIKPVVASWLKSRDPLEQIAESCKKRDLKLRLRIATLQQPVIASRYPDGASKTFLGDVAMENLSASNPDVVELLRATAIDLSNRCSPSAIELDEARFHSGSDAPYSTRFENACEMGLGFDELWNLSFDESSAQSAISRGVDMDAVTRWVKVATEGALTKGDPLMIPISVLMERTPVLKAYVDSQREDVTALVTKIDEAVECPVSTVLQFDCVRGSHPRFDCATLNREGGLILDTIIPDAADEDHTWDIPGTDGLEQSQLVRQIRTDSIHGDRPEQFISKTKQFADEGCSGVILASFGTIAPEHFGPIKKAFRFVSRSSH